MDTLCQEYPDKPRKDIDPSENENTFVIQDELLWGASYRHFKKKAKDNKLLQPVEAPIDIPFELCRAGQQNKQGKHTQAQKKKLPNKQKVKKLSLLEKSVLSQSKYMEYLSIPNPKYEEPPIKKRKRRCEIEPCPPRFVQLAVPNKRRVFANWKDYHTILPTEMLLRFEQILHTDKNLEPRDARYYYKKIDKEKKKRARAKKRLLRKKKKEKEKGDKIWLESHIDESVKTVLDFIKNEPLFSLNYKQVMLSDGILTKLDQNKILKKPRRNSRNHYKKTIVEVCDKLALWMDTLTKFVDVQAIDSKEDIPPLTMSSLDEGEEEESEEESSEGTISSEGEREEEGEEIGEEEGEEIGEEEGGSEMLGEEGEEEGETEEATKLWDYQAAGEDEFDYEASGGGKTALVKFFDDLGDLNMDLLDQLIEMYENSPEEFLMSEVERMPGVIHMDILNKLRELKGELIDKGPKRSTLENAMVEWAKEVAPDRVDEKLLKAIHEYACALNDKLKPLLGTDADTGILPDGIFDIPFGDQDEEEDGGEGVEKEGDEYGDEAEGGADNRAYSLEPDHLSETPTDLQLNLDSDFERDEAKFTKDIEGEGYSPYGVSSGELEEEMEGEEETEIDVLYEAAGMGEEGPPEAESPPVAGEELAVGGEAEGIIKGHKPAVVVEHSPDTVCCLSLKIWAVWLLEITHNAHTWTKWVHEVIKQVREFAAIVRGDVKLPNGEPKILYKEDWRKFTRDTEEKIIAWRQYSAHVKDLSNSIIDNFHGKKVNCCPKCLQDHLIKNVVTAHETFQALTEAMNCAGYWQRCLDNLVQKTTALTDLTETTTDEEGLVDEESDDGDVELEEFDVKREDSDESIYEIEELDPNAYPFSRPTR